MNKDLAEIHIKGFELREIEERFEKLTKHPHTIDMICGFIAEGGDLHDLADVWQVRFGKLSNWISRDPERRKRYEAAHQDAEGWLVSRIIKELKTISFFDIKDLYGTDGNLLPPHSWPEHARRAVAGVKSKELFDMEGNPIGQIKEVKLIDRTRTLELVGKQLGMFVQKHQVEVKRTLEDIMAESREGDPK